MENQEEKIFLLFITKSQLTKTDILTYLSVKYLLQGERITHISSLLHTHIHTIQRISSHNALKMSHNKLLSGVPKDRKSFVWKVFNEMENNAIANIHGREN